MAVSRCSDGPDARQRGDQPEPGLLRDADPAGPHLGRGRGGQDQQRPGPDGPARPGGRRGPVRGGRSGGPRRDRTTQARVRGAGRVDAVTAAMPVTTLPSWRAGGARRSARPGRRRPRRGWRGRRSPWRRLAAAVGVPGVGAGDGVAEIPLDPGQGRVTDPVHADLLGRDPGQVPAEAGPQVVIAAGGDRPPVGVPQQLPVRRGVPLAGRARPGGPSRWARPAASGPSRPSPAAGSGTGPGPGPAGAAPARRRGGRRSRCAAAAAACPAPGHRPWSRRPR